MDVRSLLAWPRPATVRRSPLPEVGRSSQIERNRRIHLVAAATRPVLNGLVGPPRAAGVNGIACLEEQAGILDPNDPLRIPYLESPDWSKGLVVEENDTAHDVSKIAGAGGVEVLTGAAIARLAKLRAAAQCVTPARLPQTLSEVGLPARIRAAGGASLREAGEFFGWKPSHVTKGPADFTKESLLGKGWTRERLLDVAEGYEHIARITPGNPSAAGRASQLRDIAARIYGN